MKKFLSLSLLFSVLAINQSFGAGLEAPTGLQFTGASPNSLTLTWLDNSSSEKFVRVYWVQACLSTWTSFDLPRDTVSHTITGLAPFTSYRFKVAAYSESKSEVSGEVIGQTTATSSDYVIGPYRLYSQFADANADRTSGFIIADDAQGYLALYNRDGTSQKIATGLSTFDLYISSEVSLVGDRAIISHTSASDLSLNVREYQVTNSTLVPITTLKTGIPGSRWIDSFKCSDGRVVVGAYQQDAGIAGWFVSRSTDGVWHDHGKKVFIPAPANTQPAGVIRMAEDTTGNLWVFAMKDSWGTINAFRVDADFNTLESVQVVSHEWANGGYVDGLMTPHGELPIYFKVATDVAHQRILMLYQNEERAYVGGVSGWSLAKMSLTAWNADRSKQLVSITEQYTERVYGNCAINFTRDGQTSILRYSPLPLDAVCGYFPLLENERAVSTLPLCTSFCMNRRFNDSIYIRTDGNIVVTIP